MIKKLLKKLGDLKATGTYNLNDKVSISSELEKKSKSHKLTLGFKNQINGDLTVRGKVDSDKNVSIACKRAWK